MARPRSKDPKSEFLTIRITKSLRERFDTLYERSYSSLEKQQFAGLLLSKGIERLERLEKLEAEDSSADPDAYNPIDHGSMLTAQVRGNQQHDSEKSNIS